MKDSGVDIVRLSWSCGDSGEALDAGFAGIDYPDPELGFPRTSSATKQGTRPVAGPGNARLNSYVDLGPASTYPPLCPAYNPAMRFLPRRLHPRIFRRTMSTTPTPLLSLPSHPLFKALAAHPPHAPAVTHLADKRTFTYANLLADISSTRRTLLKPDLENARVSLLVENSYEFVGAQFSPLSGSALSNTNKSRVSVGAGVKWYRGAVVHKSSCEGAAACGE